MGAISDVRTQLKAILDALVATTDLVSAYDYQPVNVGTTPIATVVFESGGEDLEDSINNTFNIDYTIRVIVEDTGDFSAQITKLLGLVDNILDELRKDDNWTLSGVSYFALSTAVSPVFGDEAGDIEVLYQEIKVTTKVLKSTV